MIKFNRPYHRYCTKELFLMLVCGLENRIKLEVSKFSATITILLIY